MPMDRRTFLATTAAAATSSLLTMNRGVAEMTAHATTEPFIQNAPEATRDILAGLHDTLVAHGCTFKPVPGETANAFSVLYSGMNFTTLVDGETVRFTCEYDIRGFLDFYRNTDDEKAKELLFASAIPCCYCIDDKCTTLLTDRTIRFRGQEKKLCGPYRHRLDIPVNADSVESAKAIVDMAFRYCTPAMHKDLFYVNDVTFEAVEKPEFWVVGYLHQANVLNIKTEQFIEQCLAVGEDGKRRIDALLTLTGQQDTGSYIGVTDNFVSGSRYDFILGIPCDRAAIPAELPAGVMKVKLLAGEYDVYNSSAGDYGSVWQHFTQKSYDIVPKGYDTHRIPFEYYDRDGKFRDVHIPVSADMPKDSGFYSRVTFTPDIRIAGILSTNETDHPQYRDETGLMDKLKADFPLAESIVGVCTHTQYGLPLMHHQGVAVSHLDVIPEGYSVHTLRGGYWLVASCRHFTGNAGERYLIDGLPFKSAVPVDALNHPRGFIAYDYVGRGGFSEFAVPVRRTGERRAEIVQRDVCLLVGKEEAPPESTITEADVEAFYDFEGNLEPGSFTAAFRYEAHALEQGNGIGTYFAKPVIRGAEVASFDHVPEGMKPYTLEGGKCVRVTETLPNGEYDWWTGAYVFGGGMERDTGCKPDLSRLFFVRQTGYGRQFELYAPVV